MNFWGHRYQLILGIALFFIASSTYAQHNLVPNGSFEKARNKRGKHITNALPWRNYQTVDYYTTPFKQDTSRFKGARTGKAYAGLRFQRKYREFAFVKLLRPLKAGQTYKVEAYIKLAYWSNVKLRSFGVHIGKRPYRIGEEVDTLNSIRVYDRSGLHDGGAWIRIGGTYKAQGRERYLTIGDFSESIKKDWVKLNPFKFELMKSEAYYFLDDVYLGEGVDSSSVIMPEPVVYLEDTLFSPGIKFEHGKPIVLYNVFFEPGTSQFTYESLTQLDKFVTYLEDNPYLNIRLMGHTDDRVKRSRKISKERAEAVCDYLLSKDAINNLYFEGFSDAIPLEPNDTDEHRELNNRVEFMIVGEQSFEEKEPFWRR